MDSAAWSYHPDEAVNVAAAAITLPPKLDCVYFETSFFVDTEGSRKINVAAGEYVKIIALCQLNQSDQRDLSIVHSGHLAVVPEKGVKIPAADVETGKLRGVEGFLVESQAAEGLNGSPVFIRRPVRVRHARPTGDVMRRYMAPYLLGMVQSPWAAPADGTTATGPDIGDIRRIPPNLAIVVPAQRIMDVVSLSRQLEEGRTAPGERVVQVLNTPVSPSAAGGNPRHREDFARLLDRAVKKRPPPGDT